METVRTGSELVQIQDYFSFGRFLNIFWGNFPRNYFTIFMKKSIISEIWIASISWSVLSEFILRNITFISIYVSNLNAPYGEESPWRFVSSESQTTKFEFHGLKLKFDSFSRSTTAPNPRKANVWLLPNTTRSLLHCLSNGVKKTKTQTKKVTKKERNFWCKGWKVKFLIYMRPLSHFAFFLGGDTES